MSSPSHSVSGAGCGCHCSVCFLPVSFVFDARECWRCKRRRVAADAPQLRLDLEVAGLCNTGQSLMGEILSPSDGSNRALLS